MEQLSFYKYSKNPSLLERLFPQDLQELIIEAHTSLQVSREELLHKRVELQKYYDEGGTPTHLHGPEKRGRPEDWKVSAIPEDMLLRRVEITGPAHLPKIIVKMLSRDPSSGKRADTAMIDLEDSLAPTWPNILQSYENILNLAKQKLSYKTGNESSQHTIHHEVTINTLDMARPMIRVRGLHLDEVHVTYRGTPISASIVDFLTTAYHSSKAFRKMQMTPKFYIPKTEQAEEVIWWNKLFRMMESHLDFPLGTIKCSYLIETLPASFQVEDILWHGRERIIALNCGRWDKIFSDIKVLKNHRNRVMADRNWITMERPWMLNYAKTIIKQCHKRGAMALGGMSAFTPGKQESIRREQTEKVLQDKQMEFQIGHDGCWVSHPYFIGPALSAFPKKNQLDILLEDFTDTPDLIPEMLGPKTLSGLTNNIQACIAYLKSYYQGTGCLAWNNLMEDLATLEIARAQVWQWLHHKVLLDTGEKVTKDLILKTAQTELEKIIDHTEKNWNDTTPKLLAEIELFKQAHNKTIDLCTSKDFPSYLTTQSFHL